MKLVKLDDIFTSELSNEIIYLISGLHLYIYWNAVFHFFIMARRVQNSTFNKQTKR